MVDSSLPPEDPQATAAQDQPGPEPAIPAAVTEASWPQEGQAPAAEAPPATPEATPASETPTPGTVVANPFAVAAPGEGAAAMAPATTTAPAPIGGDSFPGGGDPVSAALPSAPFPSATPAAAAPEPVAASTPEGIASTISVPPLEGGARGEGEGGEFDLLISRVSAWLREQDLPARWEKLQGPLRGLALLLLALVLLRLYGALIDTLDSLPLVPRLLQLVGVVVLVKFSVINLVRTSDRERLISSWKQRWSTFRGRA
jgi:hypothetical protein